MRCSSPSEIDDEGRLVEQGARGFDVHLHVGQHVGHGGQVADRSAELHALVGVLRGCPIGRLGDAQSLAGDGHAGAVHQAHDVGRKAAPALADEQRRRVVELQLAGGRTVDAELVFEAADRHVLVAFVEEHRQAAGVGRALFAAGQHERHLAAAVGDEALDAVQVPVAVVCRGSP